MNAKYFQPPERLRLNSTTKEYYLAMTPLYKRYVFIFSPFFYITFNNKNNNRAERKPSGRENHIPWNRLTYWKGFRYSSRAELEFNFGYLNNILEPPPPLPFWRFLFPFRLGRTAIDTEKDHLHGRRRGPLSSCFYSGFSYFIFILSSRRWCVRDSAFRVPCLKVITEEKKKLMPPLAR
jgi:hypothetical protein